MQVSDFLDHNVTPATVLYSNFNYPVFGYYSHLRVCRVIGTGDALYNALGHLPTDGILVAYRQNNLAESPWLNWLDSNPHFRRFHEFPSLVLYEYHIGLHKSLSR
jgi:hypothetical protein